MKRIIFLSFALTILFNFGCDAQVVLKKTANALNQIETYYFHNSVRCTTCKTVEAEAKSDLLSLYGEQLVFKSMNLEEASTNAIAEKLKISGQTLLIVKGDQRLNLTNEGFLYAVSNPAKFKKIIKQKVDKLLEL